MSELRLVRGVDLLLSLDLLLPEVLLPLALVLDGLGSLVQLLESWLLIGSVRGQGT